MQYALGLITREEVHALRRYVDAEYVGSKALKLRASPVGFGEGLKSYKKGKKRK